MLAYPSKHMDRLELRLDSGQDEDLGRWVGVHLLVNGVDLRDLVTDYELRCGYDPAGDYDAIDEQGLQPAIARLTGIPNSWPGGDRTVLLVCQSCRDEGCWPIYARVVMGGDVVEWRDFEQPHRPERDYSGLRYTFARPAYDAEISRVLGA
jgi:hypothetical protein